MTTDALALTWMRIIQLAAKLGRIAVSARLLVDPMPAEMMNCQWILPATAVMPEE